MLLMRFGWVFLLGSSISLCAQTVDFARQVHPVFVARCLSCHTGASGQAGLSLSTREDMLRGGKSGPALTAGDSSRSLLLARIEGRQGARMPLAGEPLNDREIATIRRWIDEGAKVNAAAPVAAPYSLALRPPKTGGIDPLLSAYYTRHKVAAAAPVSDQVFARRAYYDLWGLPPTPQQQTDFAADKRPGKRALLIDALLANRNNYAEHWISFWNDLLHNDEGVVYHGERASITPWLLKSLEDNRPYDEFVRTLLAPNAKGDPAGFVQGVTWRGTVNASQTPAMQAAQNSAQVFLGVNLKCNSCHDSFISHWKLRESYALASFFTSEPLEIVRCDMATGKMAEPTFLFPELGGVDAKAALADKRAAAARMFTAKENGLFSRTIVNRVWRLLFGHGLIEPIDEMEGAAWYPELLDWLAADFVEHGYDMKHLLRTVMNSQAYQRPSVAAGNLRDTNYVFSGPWPRRLTAEQFADSVAAITGDWRTRVDNRPVPGMYAREWRFKANPLSRALGRPVRDGAVTERQTEATTLQALELTNGRALNEWLSDGAKLLTGKPDPAPVSLFDTGMMRATAKVPVDIDVTGRRELRLLVVDVDSYDPSRVKVLFQDAELTGADGVKPIPVEPALGREVVVNLPTGATRLRGTFTIDKASNQSDISPAVRAFLFDQAPNWKRLVRAAGEPPVPRALLATQPAPLVRQLYRYSLGRDPVPAEQRAALALVERNGQVNREGLQDLMWALLLSPEFQFIR